MPMARSSELSEDPGASTGYRVRWNTKDQDGAQVMSHPSDQSWGGWSLPCRIRMK